MSQHIEDFFEEKARAGDGSFAIAYALLQSAKAQEGVAIQLKHLGVGDTYGPGAVELVAKELKEGSERLASALLDALDR